MNYLVDTTVWVVYLRGLDVSVKETLTGLIAEEKVFISEVIIMEILRGAKSERAFRILREDLLALPQLETSHEVWEEAWSISFRLRRKGVTIPFTDTLIAATALHYRCALLHVDRHFELVADHFPLQTVKV